MSNLVAIRRFFYFFIGIAVMVVGFLLWYNFFVSANIITNENIVTSITASTKDSENNETQKKLPLDIFSLSINTENLNIEAPIVNGVTFADLSRGLGKHRTTAFPNEESGNVVISGHRWYPGDNINYTIFKDLDKLNIGNRVSIFYKDKEYIYEIFEQKTLDADAIEILEQTEEPQLTLYTCTPIYTALKRLVYVAKLVEVHR